MIFIFLMIILTLEFQQEKNGENVKIWRNPKKMAENK